MAPGMVALKSVKPPLDALVGARVTGAGRRGKMPHVDFAHEGAEPRADAARPHDVGGPTAAVRQARLAARQALPDPDPVRGRARAAPARVRDQATRLVEADPDGRASTTRRWSRRSAPRPGRRPPSTCSPRPLDQPRHLHPLLRDQRTIAGIGRSWVDEILWQARLSPVPQGRRARAGRARAPPRRALASSAPRSTPTSRPSARRSRTRCRCRSRSTGARASPAPAAARRSPRSTTRTTSPVTARTSRTTASCFADRRLSRLLK